VIQSLTKPLEVSLGISQSQSRYEKDSWLSKCWDGFWIFSVLLFVLPPLVVVAFSGLNKQTFDVLSSVSFWHAFATSIQIALMASSIALLAGVAILITSRRLRLKFCTHKANGIELIGTIILVTPGLVLSTGIFLLCRMFTDVFSLAMGIVVVVNAMMGLPYVIKTLAQPMLHVEQQYQYLCSSLGIRGLNRLKVVEWRALRKPFAHAFSISFMLAFGDLSAVALFGSQDFRTLPLYLFQLLGSYQMEAAAVVSLLMLVISLGFFALIDTLFRLNTRKTHAQNR
jgi:thiamine transport system permease protein